MATNASTKTPYFSYSETKVKRMVARVSQIRRLRVLAYLAGDMTEREVGYASLRVIQLVLYRQNLLRGKVQREGSA